MSRWKLRQWDKVMVHNDETGRREADEIMTCGTRWLSLGSGTYSAITLKHVCEPKRIVSCTREITPTNRRTKS